MKTLITLMVLSFVAFVGYNSIFYQVKPYEQVFIVQFGEIIDQKKEPGIYAKVPFFQGVEYLSKKLLDLDAKPIEVITNDKKRMVVDAFIRYKIDDPLTYYTTVQNEYGAEARLYTFLESSMREVIGKVQFTDVVKDDRAGIMQQIKDKIATDAIGDPNNDRSKGIGIEVVDVRIKKADLPEENTEKILVRMITDREREAAQIRAVGDRQATITKAEADKEVIELRGNAEEQSRKIRGAADAEVTRITADAYAGDRAEFFEFYQAMLTYDEIAASGANIRLVIDPADNMLFRQIMEPSDAVLEGRLGVADDDEVPGR